MQRIRLIHWNDDPIVPPSRMAGYSGTPLPKKLGIKPGSVVALVDFKIAAIDATWSGLCFTRRKTS